MNDTHTIIFANHSSELTILATWLKPYSSVVVVSDTHTSRYCSPVILDVIRSSGKPINEIVIETGESVKNIETVMEIVQQMLDCNCDRNCCVMNIGGGMVTDIGGFAASIYKRGVDFINIPTSLLAMIDAAFGGKTGVNFQHYKNQIGSFAYPLNILVYSEFLTTLPQSELKAAYGEIVKYAVLDRQVSMLLNDSKAIIPSLALIRACIDYKKLVVAEDFKERGQRKILNLGHTFGHAIEAFYIQKEKPVKHGEAVANGLVFETFLASKLEIADIGLAHHVLSLIQKYFLPMQFDIQDADKLWAFMQKDKKNRNGNVKMVLLEQLYQALIDVDVDYQTFQKTLPSYNEWLQKQINLL